jgi:hypothetical protein
MEGVQGELVVEEEQECPQLVLQEAGGAAEAAAEGLAEKEAMERDYAEKKATWKAVMERRVSEGTMVFTVSTAQILS